MLQPGRTIPDPSAAASGHFGWKLLLLPLLFIVIRLWYANQLELSGDEAYYWTWSRSLSACYLDHPPMVAWLIRLSTSLFGNTELGVRLLGILLVASTLIIAPWTILLAGASPRAAWALQLVLLFYPITHVQAAIITPDTPAMCFLVASLPLAILTFQHPHKYLLWLLLGICWGLAMLSKYTTILPIFGMVLALALLCSDRLARRGLLLAVLAACLTLGPLFWWNYTHQWASFVFQLNQNAKSGGKSFLANLGDYLGVQFILAVPPLAILMLLAVVHTLRHWRTSSPAMILLSISGSLPLLVFGLLTYRNKIQGNWPTLAYPFLLMLAAMFLDFASLQYRRWFSIGIYVTFVIFIFLQVSPSMVGRFSPRSSLAGIGGWSKLIARTHQFAAGRPLACSRYQDASLFSFYLPGHPFIPVLRFPEDRLSQFDLWPGNTLRTEEPLVYITDASLRLAEFPVYIGANRLTLVPSDSQWLQSDLDGIQYRGRFLLPSIIHTGDAPPANR